MNNEDSNKYSEELFSVLSQASQQVFDNTYIDEIMSEVAESTKNIANGDNNRVFKSDMVMAWSSRSISENIKNRYPQLFSA